MTVTFEAKVVAVGADDTRLNFNFVTQDRGETWYLGSLKSGSPPIAKVKVDDRLRVTGEWVTDASGSRVCFFAQHVEQQP